MRDRSSRGKMRAAERHRLGQGKAPYGRKFDREMGMWSLIEEEVRIYQRIFAMALAGHSITSIPKSLNSEGVRSSAWKGWSQSYVYELLRSGAALGEYTSLDVTFSIPSVIDEATFVAAGKALERNKRDLGRRAAHPRLLSKLVMCGVCGSDMHVRTCGSPQNRQQVYRCGMWHRAHATKVGFVVPECAKVQHNVDAVEDAIWGEVERVLRKPSLLQDATGLGRGSDGVDHALDIARAERELMSLDPRMQNLLRIASKEMIDDSDLEKQFKEIRALRRSGEAQRDAAIGRREATAAMKSLSLDFGARLMALTARLDSVSFEEHRGLVEPLFPRRGLFGIRLFPDRRIEAIHRTCRNSGKRRQRATLHLRRLAYRRSSEQREVCRRRRWLHVPGRAAGAAAKGRRASAAPLNVPSGWPETALGRANVFR